MSSLRKWLIVGGWGLFSSIGFADEPIHFPSEKPPCPTPKVIVEVPPPEVIFKQAPIPKVPCPQPDHKWTLFKKHQPCTTCPQPTLIALPQAMPQPMAMVTSVPMMTVQAAPTYQVASIPQVSAVPTASPITVSAAPYLMQQPPMQMASVQSIPVVMVNPEQPQSSRTASVASTPSQQTCPQADLLLALALIRRANDGMAAQIQRNRTASAASESSGSDSKIASVASEAELANALNKIATKLEKLEERLDLHAEVLRKLVEERIEPKKYIRSRVGPTFRSGQE